MAENTQHFFETKIFEIHFWSVWHFSYIFLTLRSDKNLQRRLENGRKERSELGAKNDFAIGSGKGRERSKNTQNLRGYLEVFFRKLFFYF